MSFWLVMKQRGEGCDYTIGCGTKVVPLKAETGPEALNEAERMLTSPMYGYVDANSDQLLESAAVVDVVLEFPVAGMVRDREMKKRAVHASQVEAIERAELERLQKKYQR